MSCHSICITGDRCELEPGHVGQHRFTHSPGDQMFWPHKSEESENDGDEQGEALT